VIIRLHTQCANSTISIFKLAFTSNHVVVSHAIVVEHLLYFIMFTLSLVCHPGVPTIGGKINMKILILL
jgi:hypothetical protein